MILNDKLIELKEYIMKEAGLVEKMLNNVSEGLINKDEKLLNKVMGKQEKKVNKKEIEIDELCTNIFALYSPEAKDLRTVFMISRMNSDLERMGDHCVNIAESAVYLINRPDVKPYKDIPVMFEMTQIMLKDIIEAFISGNKELALDVCKRDELVDRLNRKIFEELISIMSGDSETIKRALNLLRITNNIEKIADLTTNIAEQTIYMVDGDVIKHHNCPDL